MDELKAEVSSYVAGTTVKITIQRPEGRIFREITLEATLVSRGEISISENGGTLKG